MVDSRSLSLCSRRRWRPFDKKITSAMSGTSVTINVGRPLDLGGEKERRRRRRRRNVRGNVRDRVEKRDETRLDRVRYGRSERDGAIYSYIYTVDGGRERETAPPLCGGSGSGGGDRASSRNLH